MPSAALSARDEAVNKIPTSVESRNDTNTDLITTGEGSAKANTGSCLVDVTRFGEVSK